MRVPLVFTKKKKKILARATRANYETAASNVEDLFAVCSETWVALDTANFVTFFSEVWQKFAKFVLVQPGPLFSSFYTKSTIFVAEGVINKLVDNFFFVTFLSEVHHVLHLLHEF